MDIELVDLFGKKAVLMLQSNPAYSSAKCVGLYQPINKEVDVSSIRDAEKVFVYPKVINNDICFYNGLLGFERGAFGIQEPITDHKSLPIVPDLVIVPCLAVDNSLYRVGYGKGYYDRYLREKNIYKIGIIYDFQLVAKITDISEFDVKLDEVIIIKL